jgi:monofunctional biosynthetic peptidoglycan transglycosylase
MNLYRIIGFGAWLSLLSLHAQSLKELNWRSVNDTVMGGVSSSSVRKVEDGVRFSGLLSLQNNGGFTSMRSTNLKDVASTVTEVMLTVKGDGRTYYMDLRSDNRRSAFSYRQSFSTKAGEKSTLRLPLRDFVATSFGRRLPGVDGIRASRIQSVGITLADGKPGPFRLDILDIRFEETELEPRGVSDGRELIEQAISMGVPLYNDGDAPACAMIYEVALQSFLIDGHPEVSPEQQQALRSALSAMPSEMDARAWALRRELDLLYGELKTTRL